MAYGPISNEPDNSEQFENFLFGLRVCCSVHITVMSDILEFRGKNKVLFVCLKT